ncbi:hypothetical protein NA56DRAFT_703318 [Hyaloscypha hepaticicola]|uniref:Uncharacterized protein n=1 Tax=Hyaloscypha hepaticicola TaxID=2082293 RepID=A0A2J6Q5X5_9HELO|nr:hypothetical protein NA56DRAFT_703318 [Hyaloscypha hepaticicola]
MAHSELLPPPPPPPPLADLGVFMEIIPSFSWIMKPSPAFCSMLLWSWFWFSFCTYDRRTNSKLNMDDRMKATKELGTRVKEVAIKEESEYQQTSVTSFCCTSLRYMR